MAKKNEKFERPGIIMRFDNLPTFLRMNPSAVGLYTIAAMKYGQNLIKPDIDSYNLDPLDRARFETLWDKDQPQIDKDAIGWKDGIIQRKYAGYCSGQARKGEEPMSYEDYKLWYLTLETREEELLNGEELPD